MTNYNDGNWHGWNAGEELQQGYQKCDSGLTEL